MHEQKYMTYLAFLRPNLFYMDGSWSYNKNFKLQTRRKTEGRGLI